jgi:hypothetical protein
MRKLKRDRLLEAQCEADIVQVVRAYLGEWMPDELALLPPQSRPGKIRDGEDLSSLAFEVTRARFAAEGPRAGELMCEMETFLAAACARLSQLQSASTRGLDRSQRDRPAA